MRSTIPDTVVRYGFRVKPGGAHSSKTMMLPELRLLMAASAPSDEFDELRRLVLDENVLLKATRSNRKEVFARLASLYGLRRDVRLYSGLRALWAASEQDQPILAMLCALARDPLLRCTAPAVMSLSEGARLSAYTLDNAIEIAFPERYTPKTRLSTSQNAAASWAQAGYVTPGPMKTRRRAVAGPSAAAYAIFLAYLCGDRGAYLLDSCWMKALDTPDGNVDGLVRAASQQGWIDYKRIGDVVEIRLGRLLEA